MKQIITQLALFFSICVSGQSTLEIGNKAYQDEHYDIAIQNYIEAISNNQKSSDLFYNLGNAYFRTNEIGEAIWAYEQALKIDPSNTDIIYNLTYTNNLTADKLTTKSKGIGNWLTKNVFQFSENFWFYISLLSALVTAISLYFFFIPSSHLVNNLSLLLTSIFGLLLILSFTFAIMHKSRLINTNSAVIINSNSKIFTSPKFDSTISFELHEGAQLNIKRTQDDWYEVSLNKNTGWISKSEVWVY